MNILKTCVSYLQAFAVHPSEVQYLFKYYENNTF